MSQPRKALVHRYGNHYTLRMPDDWTPAENVNGYYFTEDEEMETMVFSLNPPNNTKQAPMAALWPSFATSLPMFLVIVLTYLLLWVNKNAPRLLHTNAEPTIDIALRVLVWAEVIRLGWLFLNENFTGISEAPVAKMINRLSTILPVQIGSAIGRAFGTPKESDDLIQRRFQSRWQEIEGELRKKNLSDEQITMVKEILYPCG